MFSHLAKMLTVRVVISMVVNNNWNLYHLDVNNAFLYGTLNKEVFMSLPQGYHTRGDNRVRKPLKSLYGLKQAPHKCNEKFCCDLFEFGFIQSINDDSLFVKVKSECIVVLLVDVDNIVLTGNNLK